MRKLTKQQQQVALLGVALAIIVGVLLWFYRDNFLPHPTGQATLLAPFSKLTVPMLGPSTCQDDKTPCAVSADCAKAEGTALCTYPLYKRDDFKALRRFGDVPVRAMDTEGSREPFSADSNKAP